MMRRFNFFSGLCDRVFRRCLTLSMMKQRTAGLHHCSAPGLIGHHTGNFSKALRKFLPGDDSLQDKLGRNIVERGGCCSDTVEKCPRCTLAEAVLGHELRAEPGC